MVLQLLIFMGTSDGDNHVFLMALISQSLRDWFLSQCLRLCSPCLQEGWEVTSLSFLLPPQLPDWSHLLPRSTASQARAVTGTFTDGLKVFPNSSSLNPEYRLSDHTSFFYWTILNAPI